MSDTACVSHAVDAVDDPGCASDAFVVVCDFDFWNELISRLKTYAGASACGIVVHACRPSAADRATRLVERRLFIM
jgi:hypothetical protein